MNLAKGGMMNPEENNPLNTSGAGSAFGSLDTSATNPNGMPSAPSADLAIPQNDATMTPADSLASVESNLNSMGMGTDFSANSAANGYNQPQQPTDSSATTPQFVAPETPLTPAAPIPGSIGSAMSAPASADLPVADNTVDQSAGAAATMFTPVTNMGSLPPTNAAPNDLGVVADNPAGGHYNPFAQPAAADTATGATTAQTSTTGATAQANPSSSPFQPISADAAKAPSSATPSNSKHGHSKLNIILGIALVVTAAVAIIFVILYINASSNSKTISVTPITDNNDVVQTPIKEITCELDKGDGNNEILTLNYLGDELSNISISQNSIFENEETALAERDMLEAQRSATLNIAGLTEEPYDVSFVAEGNRVTATISATADQLRTEDADSLMLTTVDGVLDTSENTIRSNYEARGFVCSE